MTSSDEHRPDLDALAHSRFGWERLSDDQRTAIREVLMGHDVLAVMPTGSGKSAIYQVPALLTDGATLVVSPLIALQHDQISRIESTCAGTAVAINSGLRAAERRRNWEAIDNHRADFIFISPEQLANDEVVARLRRACASSHTPRSPIHWTTTTSRSGARAATARTRSRCCSIAPKI